MDRAATADHTVVPLDMLELKIDEKKLKSKQVVFILTLFNFGPNLNTWIGLHTHPPITHHYPSNNKKL